MEDFNNKVQYIYIETQVPILVSEFMSTYSKYIHCVDICVHV